MYRCYVEAKFKKGAAADLKMNPSDIIIKAITGVTRRRSLLTAHTAGLYNSC